MDEVFSVGSGVKFSESLLVAVQFLNSGGNTESHALHHITQRGIIGT